MNWVSVILFLALIGQYSNLIAGDPIDPNGFEIISTDSFEGNTIVETYVDKVIAPNESVSTNGITVTANGNSPATVKVSSAYDEQQELGILIELEGGPVTIDLPDTPVQVAAVDAPLTTANCPDPESSDYPIKYCLGEPKTANLASISYPADHLGSTRLPDPGTQLDEKFSNPYRTIFIRRHVVVSILKSACQSTPDCYGDPVLLVHGFQKELLGHNPHDNGGRNYWGYFPERLTNDGYTPNEFIWHTNAQFIDVARDLKKAIELIKAESSQKVHIVAHSFGGALTRRLLQDTEFVGVASSIASVTTIGTPHLGIFWSKTSDPNRTFPDGQDSNLFKGCGQISCHIMGENVIGSSIASLLDVAVEKGSEPRFIASTATSLPNVKIQNLVGFVQWLDLGTPRHVRNGDFLITAETQRFLADFVFSGEEPPWQDFQPDYRVGQATLTEYALGRHTQDEPPLNLQPGQQVNVTDFVEYKHSKATPGGPVGVVLAAEPYVPENEYHDGYQRVVEWLAAKPLNDTGIDWGGNYPSGNNATCTGETIAAQDCSHGRDATHNDDSDGRAGFSFTKLDANGNALPASASVWDCVRDEVTGLTWEVKTDDGGLRDTDNTYSWYNPDPNTNGGNPGVQDGGLCTGSDCDTYSYVQAVNAEAQALCGARDWRMPWREELRSIVDYRGVNPAIDTGYFLNQRGSDVWSGSPSADVSFGAWGVSFGFGGDYSGVRDDDIRVQLVRGGQSAVSDGGAAKFEVMKESIDHSSQIWNTSPSNGTVACNAAGAVTTPTGTMRCTQNGWTDGASSSGDHTQSYIITGFQAPMYLSNPASGPFVLGPVFEGDPITPIDLTISNVGEPGSTLIGNCQMSGGDAQIGVWPIDDFSVQQGGTPAVRNISCNSETAGAFFAVLSCVHNGSNASPVNYEVYCDVNANMSEVVTTPASGSIMTKSTDLGGTESFEVTFTEVANQGINATLFSCSLANGTDFMITYPTSFPVTIPANGSVTVSVNGVNPGSPDSVWDTLSCAYTDTANPSGSSVSFNLVLSTGAQQECPPGIPRSTPDTDFNDHGDGTVTHKPTGLMWKRCLEGASGLDCTGEAPSTHSWQAALQLAEGSTFAGHDDWRLPNIKELASIVELGCYGPVINLGVFPNDPGPMVWSGSPDAFLRPDMAWAIDFYYGLNGVSVRSSDNQVRLVRGGQ
jgi:pimeloyl-ACP methyl ester carboxylesterase